LDLVSLGLVVLRTLTVYVALLIGFRLMGKRGLSQMAPFDLTVLLIISNAVQNAMVGSDTSLNAGILARHAARPDRLLDRVALWRRDLIGTPEVLVQDGHILDQIAAARGRRLGRRPASVARARRRRPEQGQTGGCWRWTGRSASCPTMPRSRARGTGCARATGLNLAQMDDLHIGQVAARRAATSPVAVVRPRLAA